MKKSLIPIFIFLILSIFSCKKDNEKDQLSKATISAKWIVSGTNSNYESFEFNESGNYIIVQNSSTKSTSGEIILFGTYQIIDNQTIELSDFGKIKITSIASQNFNFSIMLQDDLNNEILISATRAAEYGSSSRMDLLCQTWTVISINGESVTGTGDAVTVLFSKAGTYLVTYSKGDIGIAKWTWKDSSEAIMCYSWDGEPTCNGDNEVQILELTQNSIKVSEAFGGETLVYVLIPANGTKSARLKSIRTEANKGIHKGIFNQ